MIRFSGIIIPAASAKGVGGLTFELVKSGVGVEICRGQSTEAEIRHGRGSRVSYLQGGRPLHCGLSWGRRSEGLKGDGLLVIEGEVSAGFGAEKGEGGRKGRRWLAYMH